MTIAGSMTVEEHYDELRAFAHDLEAMRVRAEDAIYDYRMLAEELVGAAGRAVEEHGSDYIDLAEESNALLHAIDQIDLGNVPDPSAWSMPADADEED